MRNYDAPGRENSDQATRRNGNLPMASGHMIKSFRCSFCERSFSNAQALGGHMNIHRKDRAKLKEFSDENLLSLDVTKTVNLVGEFSPPDPSANEAAANSDGKMEGIQELVPTSKHNSVRNLALFAVSDDEKNLEKNKMELIHGGLDLELRLGLEPHHDAEISH